MQREPNAYAVRDPESQVGISDYKVLVRNREA